MKYAIIIIILAFAATSFFGFTMMPHDSMGCDSVTTGMIAGDCPTSLVSMTLHHISAYTEFSHTTVVNFLATLLSLLFSLILIGFLLKRRLLFESHLRFAYSRARHNPDSKVKKELIHWLSLLEISPSL